MNSAFAGIGRAVALVPIGEGALQLGVLARNLRMISKVVAKANVVEVRLTALDNDVQLVAGPAPAQDTFASGPDTLGQVKRLGNALRYLIDGHADVDADDGKA
jgi:hypothetical protein